LTLVGLAAEPAAAASMLGPSQTLAAGNNLVSPNGQYVLSMQTDGNLVLYAGPQRIVKWSSRTNGPIDNTAFLAMQNDGNLVVYARGGPKFATGTNNAANANPSLEVQDDGNVVVYAQGHRAIWASASKGEAAISWFYARIGATVYEGKCELAVENAFGTSSQYYRAIDNWNDRARKSQAQQPYTAAPRGALVFYSTSSAGHVAISLGNGQVVTTSAPGGKIDVAPMSGWFRNPLGWAYSPWGTPW
jgi:hypothetical protein